MTPSPSLTTDAVLTVAVNPSLVAPLITGLFVLVAVLVTFLLTRSNDARKASRERDDALARETMDIAAEFIALGQRFHKIGQQSLSTPMDTLLPAIMNETSAMIDEHRVLFTRLRLVMPKHLDSLIRQYAASTVALLKATF